MSEAIHQRTSPVSSTTSWGRRSTAVHATTGRGPGGHDDGRAAASSPAQQGNGRTNNPAPPAPVRNRAASGSHRPRQARRAYEQGGEHRDRGQGGAPVMAQLSAEPRGQRVGQTDGSRRRSVVDDRPPRRGAGRSTCTLAVRSRTGHRPAPPWRRAARSGRGRCAHGVTVAVRRPRRLSRQARGLAGLRVGEGVSGWRGARRPQRTVVHRHDAAGARADAVGRVQHA